MKPLGRSLLGNVQKIGEGGKREGVLEKRWRGTVHCGSRQLGVNKGGGRPFLNPGNDVKTAMNTPETEFLGGDEPPLVLRKVESWGGPGGREGGDEPRIILLALRKQRI